MTTPKSRAPRLSQGQGSLVGAYGIFDVMRHKVTWRDEHEPRQLKIHTLRMPDWTTVVALTDDGHFVLVEQHRYGVEATVLETPGGIIDQEEPPRDAAIRELREETGFVGGEWTSLGWVHPNPALQGNRIHMWCALGVTLGHKPSFDDNEYLETVLVKRDRLPALLTEGRVAHALSALALERTLRHLGG